MRLLWLLAVLALAGCSRSTTSASLPTADKLPPEVTGTPESGLPKHLKGRPKP